MSELGQFYPDNLLGGDKKLVTEEVLLQAGQNLERGALLGRIKHVEPISATPDSGNTGDGTISNVKGRQGIIPGAYSMRCIAAATNGGTFELFGPSGTAEARNWGILVLPGTPGGSANFYSDVMSLTIADGATDFVVGDEFDIRVDGGVPVNGTADGGNTGQGDLSAIVPKYGIKKGTYTVECITAVAGGGIFSVTDPDGESLPVAEIDTVSEDVNYVSDQLNFNLTYGGSGTDWVVTDKFTIEVTLHPREVKLLSGGANDSDGANVIYAVLAEDCDASSEDTYTVAYLEGQFNQRRVSYGAGVSIEDIRDDARDLGIIFVDSVSTGTE